MKKRRKEEREGKKEVVDGRKREAEENMKRQTHRERSLVANSIERVRGRGERERPVG